MFVLKRKWGSSIKIEHAGETLSIEVKKGKDGDHASLRFDGPSSFEIDREERDRRAVQAQQKGA